MPASSRLGRRLTCNVTRDELMILCIILNLGETEVGSRILRLEDPSLEAAECTITAA